MKKAWLGLILILVAYRPLVSCTDFLIQNTSQQAFNGRSMEFAQELPWKIMVQGAGETVQSIAPGKLPGLKWTSKYSYLGMTCVHPDYVIDGLNEKGLSFGALLFPSTQYQSVPVQKNSLSLAAELLGKWVLGNFSTVAEVKEAVQKIYVWKGNLPQELANSPLHFSIHDASGNSLVIEYTQGKLNLYDNPVHVLTNYPAFDWQMTNLENYTSLRSINAPPLVFQGKKISLKGQGSGLTGMPGDYTPPSRFVRIFYNKYFATTPVGVNQSIALSFHLLNTVDIPYGVVKEKAVGNQTVDFTRWSVVKDLSNATLYLRTYQNANVYRLSLNEIKLAPGQQIGPITLDQPVSYSSIALP